MESRLVKNLLREPLLHFLLLGVFDFRGFQIRFERDEPTGKEIVRGPQMPLNLAQRKPWLVAFAFGLLHGLGFAGGLSDAELPAGHIPLALALFSVGVEVGHFSFVAVMLIGIAAIRRCNIAPPLWARRVPPYAIGSVAAYWVIQRTAVL